MSGSTPTSDHVPALQWVTKTAATGAKFVQIEVDWPAVEPNAPTSADNPTSPAGAQFNFAYLDQRVEEFVGSGLQPVFLVTDAPRWAEGNGGTRAEYATGGYKPNATALGDLAEAMARRYSGSYPNPAAPGKALPRVRYYQAWAEANLNFHLSPQWTQSNGKVHSTGPGIYRSMLNAFYAGIHAGDRTDKVIASGLESYGDRPDTGLKRTPPVTFLGEPALSQLQAHAALRARPRRTSTSWLPTPTTSSGPTVHAASPSDASAPDLAKLTRIVRAAVKDAHCAAVTGQTTLGHRVQLRVQPAEPSRGLVDDPGALARAIVLRLCARGRQHRALVPRQRPAAALQPQLHVRCVLPQRQTEAVIHRLQIPARGDARRSKLRRSGESHRWAAPSRCNTGSVARGEPSPRFRRGAGKIFYKDFSESAEGAVPRNSGRPEEPGLELLNRGRTLDRRLAPTRHAQPADGDRCAEAERQQQRQEHADAARIRSADQMQ